VKLNAVSQVSAVNTLFNKYASVFILYSYRYEMQKHGENLRHLCMGLLLLRLAPLPVRSATGCQQPPEWSLLGQVNCVGPRQPAGVEVVLHRLHPGHTRSSWWSKRPRRIARISLDDDLGSLAPPTAGRATRSANTSTGQHLRHYSGSELTSPWLETHGLLGDQFPLVSRRANAG